MDEGSREDFERLFAATSTRVYNLALRLLADPHEAEDVTQEVFLRALERFPGQREGAPLEPWLYRVAVNACRDCLRMRKRRRLVCLDEAEAQEAPHGRIEQLETRQVVEATLTRLSEQHRLVLLLKDLHGFRADEIATILGISRGAAEARLSRARESFRRVFAELKPDAAHERGCRIAAALAVELVGGDADSVQRRRLAKHARTCAECRRLLARRGATLGLAFFLPLKALPESFCSPTALSASGGAGLLGGAAAPSAAGAAQAGVTVSGGLLAQVGAAVSGKVAAVVLLASTAAMGSSAIYTLQVAALPASRAPVGGGAAGVSGHALVAASGDRTDAQGEGAPAAGRDERANRGKALGRDASRSKADEHRKNEKKPKPTAQSKAKKPTPGTPSKAMQPKLKPSVPSRAAKVRNTVPASETVEKRRDSAGQKPEGGEAGRGQKEAPGAGSASSARMTLGGPAPLPE